MSLFSILLCFILVFLVLPLSFPLILLLHHFLSLLSFCSYFFLPPPSLLSILFQLFLLFFQNENFYHVYVTNFTTMIILIAFIDCLLYAKHHSKLFVYIFILTPSTYYSLESEAWRSQITCPSSQSQ